MGGGSSTLMANREAMIGLGLLASQPHWFYRAERMIIMKKKKKKEGIIKRDTKSPLRRNICRGIMMWNMRLPGLGPIICR